MLKCQELEHVNNCLHLITNSMLLLNCYSPNFVRHCDGYDKLKPQRTLHTHSEELSVCTLPVIFWTLQVLCKIFNTVFLLIATIVFSIFLYSYIELVVPWSSLLLYFCIVKLCFHPLPTVAHLLQLHISYPNTGRFLPTHLCFTPVLHTGRPWWIMPA